MRDFGAATNAAVASGEFIAVLAVEVRAPSATVRIANTDDDLQLRDWDNVQQVYYGTGQTLGIEGGELAFRMGLDAEGFGIVFEAGLPETDALALASDVQDAPIRIGTAIYTADRVQTGFIPWVAGLVESSKSSTPSFGRTSVRLVAVERKILLHRKIDLRKTDEDHRRRQPDDGFYRYGSQAAAVKGGQ